jgi:hypothetical protein
MYAVMPLRDLDDSVKTLKGLIQDSRASRERGEIIPGAQERSDRRIDEALETIESLVQVLRDAHQRGDLTAMLKRDNEEDFSN